MYFNQERELRITSNAKNSKLKQCADEFFVKSVEAGYCYNFEWMGFPIIQYPQDIVALQEIIFRTKPNIIIETGFARGGSSVFFASLLTLLQHNKLITLPPKVVSIDVKINQKAIAELNKTEFAPLINTIEESSVSDEVLGRVLKLVNKNDRIMVVLDSMHTHDHVLKELRKYSPLVTSGCYFCALDTAISYLPADTSANRPWSPDNSPFTAVKTFLEENQSFSVDSQIDDKLLVSVARSGYLIRS